MGKVKFTTTIDESLLEQIKILAIKEKCSVSAILERLIKEYLEKNEGE
ncbi:ribbon-helix-helix domain-containing protein [Phocaeicola sartorii]|nr:ribbon-helix-helix domain-containing protein [Phocaeicola sartorii]